MIKRLCAIVSACALTASHLAAGGYRSVGDVRASEWRDNRLTLDCGGPRVEISVLARDLVRVRLAPTGECAPEFSYAVVRNEWPRVICTMTEDAEQIALHTEELEVRVRRRPCRVAFYTSDGKEVCTEEGAMGMAWDGPRVQCFKKMPQDELYYGLGEKTGRLNKRGRAWVMWNTDYPGYNAATDPLYQSHPFFIALRRGSAYGIFFHNTHRSTFKFAAGTQAYYSFGADGGELDYYFFYGPSIKKVLARYTELVGRMPLPPLWALGYQQCRWSYYPEAEVRTLAQTFRQKGIPCDALYLDIHYMDGYRCFTWDSTRFPDPGRLLGDLEAMGFKVVVIIDPGIKVDPNYWVCAQGLAGDHFCRLPDGSLHISQVWPGDCYFPDFTRPETRRWWGGLYAGLVRDGVAGFWNDMNEPGVWGGTFPDIVQHTHNGQMVDHPVVHNVYGLDMARGTYEGVRALRPDRRPFVLTRAGFAGVQRYAAVWTGDNVANWEHLRLALSMCLGLGLSGVPFVGFDIGGFEGSPSPELFTRFLQLGALTPLCRNHTSHGTRDQEPWAFGENFEELNRQAICLRYELLPYLYNVFREASLTGLPVMRPLVMEFQQDPATWEMDDEFLLGDALLAAPVLHEGARMRWVHLPEGDWYDFYTNRTHRGPVRMMVEAPLERIPLFVRAGSLIPMQEPVNYVGEKPSAPLILSLYPAQGAFVDSVYEDAGDGFAYQEGEFAVRVVAVTEDRQAMRLVLGPRRGTYQPPRRHLLLRVNGSQAAPRRVMLQGQLLPQVDNTDALQASERGWCYEASRQIAWVKVPESSREIRVELR
ncbi:MAG: DUF4968 domain-containing protein [candidate division KSB1 bacterium]|nr:DUF4968 domain-containing protein [candidate division KSB1 bacterium]